MYSFIRINFQTHMVVFSRKSENCSYSKVNKALYVVQIKLIMLGGKIVDCVFNGYLIGRKIYKLLGMKPGGLKFINCRYINFNETRKGKKIKYMRMKLLGTKAENIQFEVKIPTIDISNSEGSIIEVFYYHLTRDNVRRKIIPSHGGAYICLEYYALHVVEELKNS